MLARGASERALPPASGLEGVEESRDGGGVGAASGEFGAAFEVAVLAHVRGFEEFQPRAA